MLESMVFTVHVSIDHTEKINTRMFFTAGVAEVFGKYKY
jgi:hypothetical protein